MKKISAGMLAGISLSMLAAVPAHAAPVTVNVRVEGPSSTLFEAPVTTDTRTFRFTGDPADHQCDGTSGTGGTSPTPVPVRNGALLTGLEGAGIPVHGMWFSFGPAFTDIGGTNVDYDGATNRYLVEYKNGVAAQLGGCSDPIAAGDDVLYAYATGSETVLKLTGPATVKPGSQTTVKVSDADGGTAVAGAAVGGQTTGADGTATVGPFADRGPQPVLKATKSGAIRSNALSVCVTDGADGFCGTTAPGRPAAPAAPCAHDGDDGRCGTPDMAPALGQVKSVREQQRFAKGKGPRTLGGAVNADPSGLKLVELRLTRTVGGRCSTFDAKRERFVALTRCGAANGTWFAVGSSAEWSYLLPERLGRGRYVLDVRTTDSAGNVDEQLQRTRNRIVFHVS